MNSPLNITALLLVCTIAITHPHFAHATPSTTPEPQKVHIGKVEAYPLGFSELSSFPFKIVDLATGASPNEIEAAKKQDQVPAQVRRYDKQRVVLTGFMLPLQMENGLAKKFFMMRDTTTCCYGKTPNMNDFVVVTMKEKGAEIVQDLTTRVVGIFRIQPKYEQNYMISLFEIEGERLLGTKK